MHELGLCDGVVEAVRKRAHGRPVAWARLRIGGHPVTPDVIAQGVAVAAVGTEADGLALEVVMDPLRSRCGRCGAEEPVGDALALAACPRCGGVDLDVVGCEHAVLEALRYRSPEAAPEPPPAGGRTGAPSSHEKRASQQKRRP